MADRHPCIRLRRHSAVSDRPHRNGGSLRRCCSRLVAHQPDGCHVVVNEGRADVTPENAEEHVPDEKESKVFIAFLAVLLLVIIGFFVWAMKSI